MLPKSEAIVLKSIDFRETSRIVTFFTRDFGKIKGILKGIRKDPRKFGSSVDRYTINDIVYYHYSRSEIHLVSHCDLKQFFLPIRQNYKRSLAANYMLELIDAIMPAEEPNKDVYALILRYLESLQVETDVDRLVYILQIKTLMLSGFRPHIDACIRCRKKITGKVRFSMKEGGLVCPHCPTSEMSFTLISPGTIATMLHIEKASWQECLKLGLAPTIRRELKFILNNFLVYHLEKHLKSTRHLSLS